MAIGLHQKFDQLNRAQSQGPVPQQAYSAVTKTGPRPGDPPPVPPPFVIQGDATGGGVPWPREKIQAQPWRFPDTGIVSPDGTGGPTTTSQLGGMLRGNLLDRLAAREAERQARMGPDNLLQGLFGGTPSTYTPSPTVQYPNATSGINEFDTMMSALAQYQNDANYWPDRYLQPDYSTQQQQQFDRMMSSMAKQRMFPEWWKRFDY